MSSGRVVLVACVAAALASGACASRPLPPVPSLLAPRPVVAAPLGPAQKPALPVETPPPAAPARLADPPPPVGSEGFDVDPSGFSVRPGARALVRASDGDTSSRLLSRAIAACLRGPGTVYVRLAVTPRKGLGPLVQRVASEGPNAAVECVARGVPGELRLRADADPVVVEVLVLGR